MKQLSTSKTFFYSKPIEVNQKQEDYAFEVNPVDSKFLKETHIEKKSTLTDVTLWDHLQVKKIQKNVLLECRYGNSQCHQFAKIIDGSIKSTFFTISTTNDCLFYRLTEVELITKRHSWCDNLLFFFITGKIRWGCMSQASFPPYFSNICV